jgi:hypothetical protein
MCVFKSLTTTDYDSYGNRNAHFYGNNIKVNEELMLVILNSALLNNQNDRWTVERFVVRIFILKCYLKKHTWLHKNCMTLEHFY